MATDFIGVGKLTTQGYDTIAWNYRSCSGELNRQRGFYTANDYMDLELVINWAILRGYKKVSLIGFSIGANLTGFYLGDKNFRIPSEITSAILISAPIDIEESTLNLNNWHIGKVYTESFLSTMRKKIKLKHEIMGLPGIDIDAILRVKTFKEFDDLYTAPANGYSNAKDYYQHASAKRVLHNIKIPTLILNAENDPFLGENCYPDKIARNSKNIFLEKPKSGGHVGFVCFKDEHYWSEKRALEFLNQTT